MVLVSGCATASDGSVMPLLVVVDLPLLPNLAMVIVGTPSRLPGSAGAQNVVTPVEQKLHSRMIPVLWE